jgi:peptide-methionine (S)-S-oxide reductase
MIVTHSPEQERVAREVTDAIQKKHFDPKGTQIVTEIVKLSDTNGYWKAEPYHQLCERLRRATIRTD